MRDLPGIDPEPLDSWFGEHIADATPPLDFEPITGGHSNLTYRVADSAGTRFVLRRPPLGHLLASAHDMAREHRIISAVGTTDVPVPRALGLCEDDAVNGAPFYVMNFVDGVVLETAEDSDAYVADHSVRRTIGEDIADVLADLHRVNIDGVGLGELARRESYLDRQLKRWRGQWEKSRTRDLPAMDRAYEALLAAKPEQRYTGIVHGDYRIGNLLVRPDDGRLAAVLDWELCTLGDVLADVGYLLNNWVQSGEDTSGMVEPPPTFAGGFPTRDEVVDRYAARTGFDVADIAYYRAFSHWRMAAIVEGVKRRYLDGQMIDDDVDTDIYERRVVVLADEALALLG